MLRVSLHMRKINYASLGKIELSVQVEDIPDVVGACCVLHNICHAHSDS